MRWPVEQQNYFQLLLALAIILGSIIFIIYKKKNSKHMPDHERHIMELIIREQEKNKRLAKRLEAIEEELAVLEEEVTALKCERYEIAKTPASTENKHSTSFQNNLQYQTFMQKNQELVLLLQNGLSIEKAAKVSNRSIREAEMVEAVLKQRLNS